MDTHNFSNSFNSLSSESLFSLSAINFLAKSTLHFFIGVPLLGVCQKIFLSFSNNKKELL